MREILFRGKRIDNGEWVEGAFLNDRDGAFYICPAASDISVSYGDNGRRMRIGCWYNVDPSTVGQYTGLTDKNGKRIFEGDICRVKRPCVLAYGNIAFKNGCFWFVDDGPGGMLRLCDAKPNGFDIEVIGSIHDNPEPVKEADHDQI